MSKRITEFTLLGGFLVLAVLLYRSTAAYPAFVQGSTAEYVRFLGMSLGLLCVFELFLTAKKVAKENKQPLNITSSPRLFWGLFILLCVYAASFELLGFYLASAVFLPLAMCLLGARKPHLIGLASAGVILFVYLVFEKTLGVFMPASSLFG